MSSYTIIFTTYNDEIGIIPFLKNIMRQTLAPECIIMADGGSRDNTVQLAEDFKKETKCSLKIICGRRLNIAEGYNAAIREVKTEYIGIVGMGNFYDDRHFEYLMENSHRTGTDISYAVIKGQNTTDFSRWYNSFFLNGENGKIGKIPSNHGALVRRSVFQEIGYFCEKFYYAGEDTEFYFRALKQGVTVSAVKAAVVYWETPKTFGEYLRQIELYTIGDMQAFDNRKLFRKKWKGVFYWFLVVSGLAVGVFARQLLVVSAILPLVVLYFLIRFHRYGFRGSLLCMLSKFLPTVFMVKNYRYFCADNKVHM